MGNFQLNGGVDFGERRGTWSDLELQLKQLGWNSNSTVALTLGSEGGA